MNWDSRFYEETVLRNRDLGQRTYTLSVVGIDGTPRCHGPFALTVERVTNIGELAREIGFPTVETTRDVCPTATFQWNPALVPSEADDVFRVTVKYLSPRRLPEQGEFPFALVMTRR